MRVTVAGLSNFYLTNEQAENKIYFSLYSDKCEQ